MSTLHGVSLSEVDGPRCWCPGDMNLLKVPQNLTDDQVVLLSDVLPTSWCVASSVGMRMGKLCMRSRLLAMFI